LYTISLWRCFTMHFKKLVLSFFEDLNTLIRSPQFLRRHRLNRKFFTRNRKLDFPGIICFLLRLPQKSLSSEMADYVSGSLGSWLPPASGGYPSRPFLQHARKYLTPHFKNYWIFPTCTCAASVPIPYSGMAMRLRQLTVPH